MRLMAQHKDTSLLAQQIHHVLNFCHWAISTGSSTALLYSKRLVCFYIVSVLVIPVYIVALKIVGIIVFLVLNGNFSATFEKCSLEAVRYSRSTLAKCTQRVFVSVCADIVSVSSAVQGPTGSGTPGQRCGALLLRSHLLG